MLHATIPGAPVAKGRPRATTVGGRARLYTPAKTRQWEAKAAECIRAEWGQQEPLQGPVCVSVLVVRARPSSKTWKRKPMPPEWAPTRPDLDNYVKAALDAVSRAGVWVDDSQVIRLTATKRIAAGGELPRVEVRVRPAEGEPYGSP